MDGPYYCDLKTPWYTGAFPNITLTSSYQLASPLYSVPGPLGNYFNYVGKALRIRACGSCTSGATPGALTLAYLWGNGTAGSGTLVAGVSVTWTANGTNNCFFSDIIIRCKGLGTTGTLFGIGLLDISGTGVLPFPASAPSNVTVDLTQPFYLTLQTSRSGTTAESLQLYDIFFEAIN